MKNTYSKTKMPAIAAAILVSFLFSASVQAQSGQISNPDDHRHPTAALEAETREFCENPTVYIDGQQVNTEYMYPQGTSNMLYTTTTSYGKVELKHTSSTARIFYAWMTLGQSQSADSVPLFMEMWGGFVPKAREYDTIEPLNAPLESSYLKFVVLDSLVGSSFRKQSEVCQVMFFRDKPNLNIASNNENYGYVTGDKGRFDAGTEVTVNATAQAGYRFVKWEVEDKAVSSQDSYSFILHKSMELVAIFEPSTIVFQTDGNWSEPNNWNTKRIPEFHENVLISAAAVVPSGYLAQCKNIEITGSGSLTINDGGRLYHANEGVVATVKKQVAAYTVEQSQGDGLADGWRFIAHPMSAAVDVVTATNLHFNVDYDLYAFDQSQGLEWRNFKEPANNLTQLAPGKGYLYAHKDGDTVRMTGTLNRVQDGSNNTSIFVDLDYDGSAILAGWNLVGNPFPMPAYASKSYYAMNADGTAIEPVAVSTTTPVPVCTGVMVKADGENETVGFSIDPDAWQTAPRQGNIQIAVAQANTRGASAGSASVLDKAIVSFNKADLLPKFDFNEANAKLYIPQKGQDYAIAYFGAAGVSGDVSGNVSTGEVPVHFKAARNGEYALSVSLENLDFDYLHLIDNMTGADVDLLGDARHCVSTYTFTAKTTDYASRFRLVYATGGGREDSFAYFNNGNLVVNSAGAATLQMVDLMGRIIVSKTVSGSTTMAINAAPGVYMLRLINGDSVKVQKVVVR